VYRQETAWANVEETAQQHCCRPVAQWSRDERSFQGHILIRNHSAELPVSEFSMLMVVFLYEIGTFTLLQNKKTALKSIKATMTYNNEFAANGKSVEHNINVLSSHVQPLAGQFDQDGEKESISAHVAVFIVNF